MHQTDSLWCHFRLLQIHAVFFFSPTATRVSEMNRSVWGRHWAGCFFHFFFQFIRLMLHSPPLPLFLSLRCSCVRSPGNSPGDRCHPVGYRLSRPFLPHRVPAQLHGSGSVMWQQRLHHAGHMHGERPICNHVGKVKMYLYLFSTESYLYNIKCVYI